MFSRWRYRGRHRGEFAHWPEWSFCWSTSCLGGVHRGRYVEDPAWKTPRQQPGMVYQGTSTVTLSFVPDDGLLTLPALIQGSPGEPPTLSFADIERFSEKHQRQEREQEIRDIVNDELASTPVYTALRYEGYGRFGDVDIDRADAEPLCILVEIESD